MKTISDQQQIDLQFLDIYAMKMFFGTVLRILNSVSVSRISDMREGCSIQ